ncbi:MAG: transmembrane region and signal peptide prediction [Rhodospirillaceae bacterium]|nr:MAG: transmembrane region and signal peptide prediction [Rhodospirillaceae bacterium]
MTALHRFAFFLASSAIGLVVLTGSVRAEPVSFTDDVMPILKIRCVECHQPERDGYVQSGLDLRSYEGLMKGTKHGSVVVPGSAMVSNLNVLIEGRADPRLRMPHNSRKLTRCEIDILRRWVNYGALNN